MLALKLISLILFFGSISYLAYAYLPFSLRRYSQIQKTHMEKEAKKLDDQVFIATERHNLLRIFTVTPLSLGLLGFIVLRNPVGIIFGLFLGFVLPPVIMKNMSLVRRNKFENQLVDALMLLSGSLKAGMSLNQAFEVLVEEMPPPISDEFALVIRENKMGVSIEDCLAHLWHRVPASDLDLIAVAIGIVRETGGNLTEIFENLVYTIREKKKLQDRVKALTIQGRLQGYIMMVLPIVFGIFIYFTSPENFQIMLTDKLGQKLLMWSVISEGIGIILIKKLSRVEV
ncbi:MAG: type II secretion system F family protein [Candidatus Omnitrophica bacterium]|nr:type II secretion system F family protein [Candidatus Omnitrophota bacterium]